MSDSLFADKANPTDKVDPDKDYSAELIGEGKIYKDAAAIARGVIEKDLFIKKLQEENAEMRASLQADKKLDEFMTKIAELNKPAPVNNQDTTSGQSGANMDDNNNKNNTKSLSLEELQTVLDERDRRQAEERNAASVRNKLTEAFGATAPAVVAAKAAELGVPEKTLTDLAKTAPQAFLKLFDVKTQAPAPAIRTSVNAAAGSSSTEVKNNSYYKELRKKIGSAEFFKPEIQNEMFRKAKELGDAFYD